MLTAMTLVTLAVGLGLYLQLGWTLWSAAGVALSSYVALVSAHALFRRSEALRELGQEIERLENEMARMACAAGTPPAHALEAAEPLESRPTPAVGPLSPATSTAAMPAAREAGSRQTPGRQAHGGQTHGGTSTIPEMVAHSDLRHQAGHSGSGRGEPPLAGRSSAAAEPMADTASATGQGRRGAGSKSTSGEPADVPVGSPMSRFWTFRPSGRGRQAAPAAGATPDPRAGSAAGTGQVGEGKKPVAAQTDTHRAYPGAIEERATAGHGGKPGPALADPESGKVAGDVDVIHGMIRRFAEEMDSLARSGEPVAASAAAPATGETPSRQEIAIAASVGALRATAGEMRRSPEPARPSTRIERGELPPLRRDAASAGALPPPVMAAHARLAAIAEAIATQQLDVYLEPIMGLADRKPHHYELSLGLPGERPLALTGAESAAIMRGTGIRPLIDANLINRGASMAAHMDQRGSTGALFVAIGAESLTSERFLGELGEACRQSRGLPARLVLSLPQVEVRALSSAQWATISQLSTARIRFSIQDVITSFEPDLPSLTSAGFAFARIGVEALAAGLPGAEAPLSGRDLCRMLAAAGLSAVAVGIESEEHLRRAVAVGALLGQGPFLGGARQIKSEALRARGAAA